MKLPFHLKLEKMCTMGRLLDKHWVLTGSKTVRVPGSGIVVTTKRAIYAAFVGEVPDGHEVVPACGVDYCVRPDHQKLEARAASRARGLALPEFVEALSRPSVHQPRESPGILPEGITVMKVNLVKFYTVRNNSLEAIRHATGLPLHEIMKIRSGVYDEALRNVTGATKKRKAEKSLYRTKSAADLPGVLPPPPQHTAEESPGPVASEGMTEEERQWLEMMK